MRELGPDAPVARLVGIGQGGARYSFAQAHVVELGGLSRQADFDVAQTLSPSQLRKGHHPKLLAYTKHRITNAVAEATNATIQLTKANARGYRNFAQYRIAILFHCGKLDLYPTGCAH